MVSDDKVFDKMVASEPEVDYTGLNAAYYIDKYTNRPEDQGDLQTIQSMLSTAGIVNPAADAINAAIYSVIGEWGMAALSAGAIIPIIGDMNKIKKSKSMNSWNIRILMLKISVNLLIILTIM